AASGARPLRGRSSGEYAGNGGLGRPPQGTTTRLGATHLGGDPFAGAQRGALRRGRRSNGAGQPDELQSNVALGVDVVHGGDREGLRRGARGGCPRRKADGRGWWWLRRGPRGGGSRGDPRRVAQRRAGVLRDGRRRRPRRRDRTSTRLDSSHVKISYAVFCL